MSDLTDKPDDVTEESAAESEQSAVAQPDPLTDFLSKGDPDAIRATLKKHPRFAGIFGNELQRAREEERRQMQAAAQAAEAQGKEAERARLAREDPVGFAETYLQDQQQAANTQEWQRYYNSIQSEFATRVGAAYQAIPEWAELTPEDMERIKGAVSGKQDSEVIAAFNQIAFEIVSEKRARKRFDEWKAKEMGQETEATRAEVSARAQAEIGRPDLRKSAPKGKFDPGKLTDDEFDRWWHEYVLANR